MENDKYVVATASGWVNVTAKTVVPISVADVSVVYGENATVVVTGLGNIVGDVITINVTGKGSQTVVVNASGMANATFAGLGADVYEIVAIYAGNETYAANSTTATLTVVKASSDVIIGVNSTYYVDDTIVVNITTVNSTSAVTVKINGKEYAVVGNNVTIPNGLANGTYIVDVVLAGDDKYNSSAKNTTFVVNKLTPTVTVDNVTGIIVGDDAVINVTGPADRNATLVVRVDNVNYAVNMTNGNATLTVKGLGPGNHTVIVTYMENDKYVVATVKSSVTVLSTLTGKDITKYYRNATQYSVQLFDTTGKAVGKGKIVTFNVNGRFYNRTTDANGIATLNINLPQGQYVITAINPVTGEMQSNNINVLPVVAAKDITMKYLDGTPFVATLVDGQGKPYKEQFVRFNINGKFYDRLTDKDGQAALNIRLPTGEYIITSSFNGANIANKITIIG